MKGRYFSENILESMSEIVDYIDFLDKICKCNNPDILDTVINVCRVRKEELENQ